MKSLRSLVVLLAVGMTGCTAFNQHANDPGFGDKAAFINQTPATEAQLQEQWNLAQQQIATSGVSLSIFANSPSGADARALNVAPHGVTVVSVPDVPIAELVTRDPRWASHSDPSGTILCSGRIAHSCTDVNSNTVYVAASLVPGACQYEFEIIILNALGYDVRLM